MRNRKRNDIKMKYTKTKQENINKSALKKGQTRRSNKRQKPKKKIKS